MDDFNEQLLIVAKESNQSIRDVMRMPYGEYMALITSIENLHKKYKK
jgi:hypothetical protein